MIGNWNNTSADTRLKVVKYEFYNLLQAKPVYHKGINYLQVNYQNFMNNPTDWQVAAKVSLRTEIPFFFNHIWLKLVICLYVFT